MRYSFIIFLFLSVIGYSQKSYPYLMIDSVGDQFIVLTLEQAQKLDNATEFSPILWKENTAYLKLVDSLCNHKISIKNLEIDSLRSVQKSLEEQLVVSSELIDVLKDRVDISDKQIYDYQGVIESELYTQAQMKKIIIDNEKTIKKQRREMNIAIGFGIVTTIISFLIAL